MKRVLILAVMLAGLAACRSGAPTQVHMRTIAFDNLYGANATLPVHVKVDGGVEQPLMAMCEGKTCTIKLPLTNAKHELELAVEQQGRRSAPTQVSIDTSSLP
jgi:hypothetical protein